MKRPKKCSYIASFSPRPVSGCESAEFENNMLVVLMLLHCIEHFYPRSTLITGTVPVKQPGVKCMAQRHNNLWIAPCGVQTCYIMSLCVVY